MTELQLYKFINDNNIEWHWQDNDGVEDVLIFPAFYHIEEFVKLLSSSVFDDGGIRCWMQQGCLTFWMKDICEYYDIDLTSIFEKSKT